jgi:hypothetical protein
MDAFLETEELKRLDTLRAIRYDPDDEDEEYPGKYFREPLESAAARNECTLGVFVLANESSQWREDAEPFGVEVEE